MTAAVAALDLPARRLVELDPALRHLGTALDRVVAARGQVHDARWTPGQGCRIAYRVPVQQGGHAFRALSVSARSWSDSDYRDDRSMPGLATAADAAAVGERLADLLGPSAAWSVEPVRYRPGSRCVLRYAAPGPTGDTSAYGKVFSTHEFARAAAVVSGLAQVPALSGVVPRVLTVWEDLHVVVVAAARGRSLSSVLGRAGAEPGAATAAARDLGALLAGFHHQVLPSAPAATQADHLTTLVGELAATHRADPLLGARCDEVVRVLRQRPPCHPEQVLAHGALRPGQVVVGEDGSLTVLDLDGVCRSDAARDLGSLSAHLTWAGMREPALRPAMEQVGTALVTAYQEAAGPVEPDVLRWWRAAALLQVAARRFRRLETAWWPLTSGLVDAAEALVAAEPPAHGAGAPQQLRPAQRGGLPADALLDAGWVTHALGEVLGGVGRSGHRPSVEGAEQVSVAAGRRTVLRYTVRGLDRSGTTTVIGKAFTEPDRARLLHQHLRVLSEGPFAGDGLHVPDPLGVVPDAGLVLYRAVQGTPLAQATDRADVLRGVRGAALWLARLHGSGVVLPRSWSPAQEGASTRAWAEVVARAYPHLGGAASRLASGWSQGLAPTGAAPQVPLHKDFHPGHVLVGDGICVIDLDEARHGDPALDVAHFCAYQEAFGPARRDARLQQLFVEQYAAASGWEPGETVAGYAAYSWLKIARQWALGSGPCRGTSADERRAGAARALTRGLAWLGE